VAAVASILLAITVVVLIPVLLRRHKAKFKVVDGAGVVPVKKQKRRASLKEKFTAWTGRKENVASVEGMHFLPPYKILVCFVLKRIGR